MAEGAPKRLPILWDDRPCHDGQRNMLYLGGNIEPMLETEFQARVMGHTESH